LMTGVFARVSQWAAAIFLAVVYLASVPTSGVPSARTEGTYLLVNKNLIELAAVLVLIAFHHRRTRVARPAATAAVVHSSEPVA
jgi:thiosulfate dehydrogenase (quinone) large subunit